MDAVTFHGREYIKATRLAEEYRYTPDYLGQLARAKKVDARLVGRAWYINKDSLLEHREGKYKTPPETEITNQKNNDSKVSRIDVEPYLKTKTAKLVLGTSGRRMETKVLYEKDDRLLMPKVGSNTTPSRITVALAESEKIAITTDNKKPTTFIPDELPEVALSGTLKIKDVSDIEASKSTETEPALEKELEVVTPKKAVVVRPRSRVVSNKKSTSATGHTLSQTKSQSFTPRNVVQSKLGHRPASGRLLIPTLAVMVAFLIGLGLLATNLEILATATSYDARLNLAFTNILLLLP